MSRPWNLISDGEFCPELMLTYRKESVEFSEAGVEIDATSDHPGYLVVKIPLNLVNVIIVEKAFDEANQEETGDYS